MADKNEDLGRVENLRELDLDVEQKHVAVAMMYVFPRFVNGLIQQKSEHKMVEYNGERCLAIAVRLDSPLTDFQLAYMRGEHPEFVLGYPDWFFQQEGDYLYVGIPMSTILSADEGLIDQAMDEFGNYDVDFEVTAQEEAAEAIVRSLVDDFGKTAMALDLSALEETADVAEVDPRLATFKADFDVDPAIGEKCSWAEIQTCLLANEGHYLKLAEAMEGGGILFGVDEQGRPLIADRGDEPIMKGMSYDDIRYRVLWKHDKKGKTGKAVIGEDGKLVATGYEMFPYAGDHAKSSEIEQYEGHTGKHFVQSLDRKEQRSSWLESGVTPHPARHIHSSPHSRFSSVCSALYFHKNKDRGVRRLLRLEKA